MAEEELETVEELANKGLREGLFEDRKLYEKAGLPLGMPAIVAKSAAKVKASDHKIDKSSALATEAAPALIPAGSGQSSAE